MVRFAPPSKPVTLAPATEQCQIKSELIHITEHFPRYCTKLQTSCFHPPNDSSRRNSRSARQVAQPAFVSSTVSQYPSILMSFDPSVPLRYRFPMPPLASEHCLTRDQDTVSLSGEGGRLRRHPPWEVRRRVALIISRIRSGKEPHPPQLAEMQAPYHGARPRPSHPWRIARHPGAFAQGHPRVGGRGAQAVVAMSC